MASAATMWESAEPLEITNLLATVFAVERGPLSYSKHI
jgi:hypothetical protein